MPAEEGLGVAAWFLTGRGTVELLFVLEKIYEKSWEWHKEKCIVQYV